MVLTEAAGRPELKMMQTTSRYSHSRWRRAALLLIALPWVAAACTDRAPTAAAPAPVPAAGARLAALDCAVDVRAGTMACAPAAEPNASASRTRAADGGPRLDLIVGGQNTYIRIATAGAQTRDEATDILSGPVTVTNLMAQPMGTPDGSTVTGVKVFFHQRPVVTQGTGTVEVANPDGVGVFTGSNQPYHLYNQIIQPGATSAPETWQFRVPATVVEFRFQVYVSANVVLQEAGSVTQWAVQSRALTQDQLNDVWKAGTLTIAVSDRGTILVSNGAGWTSEPSGTTRQLYGVWTDGTAAFAVGNTWGLAGSGDVGPIVLRRSGTTWVRENVTATPTGFNDVWGSGPDDIFAGGVGGGTGVIYRRVAGVWTQMTIPTVQDIVGIWGSGPTNVYAISSNGVVLRYNGTAWSVVNTGGTVGGRTRNIHGSGPSDVYVVGDFGVVRYNGSTWASLPALPLLPGAPPLSSNLLTAGLFAASPSEVYVGKVANAHALFRWNGFSWTQLPTPPVPQQEGNLVAVHGTPGSIVWVGASGAVLTGDASGLTRSHYAVTLNDVFGSTAGTVTAVGLQGTVVSSVNSGGSVAGSFSCYRYDASTGSAQFFSLNGSADASATGGFASTSGVVNRSAGAGTCAADALPSGASPPYYGVWNNGSLYYVGNGPILRRTAGSYVTEARPGTATLYGVWGSGTTVYAVGASGTILRRDATTGQWLNDTPTPVTTATLYDVWGTSATDAFAVGANGTILRRTSSGWSVSPSGTTAELQGVWGTSATDVYAVGAGGTILRHDGVRWTRMESGVSDALTDIWGTAAGGFYAVGASSLILRGTR